MATHQRDYITNPFEHSVERVYTKRIWWCGRCIDIPEDNTGCEPLVYNPAFAALLVFGRQPDPVIQRGSHASLVRGNSSGQASSLVILCLIHLFHHIGEASFFGEDDCPEVRKKGHTDWEPIELFVNSNIVALGIQVR